MIVSFLKGLVIGAAISLPIGPIGLLCFRRMILQGALIGIVSGLGSSTADLIYASIAFFGLNVVASFLLHYQLLFRLLVSFILCIMGYHMYHTSPTPPTTRMSNSFLQAFFSTFFLTLANPVLIISFMVAGTLLKLHDHRLSNMMPSIVGIFFGSVLWWFALAAIVGVLSPRITQKRLNAINTVTGILFLCFGIGLFLETLIDWYYHLS